MPPIARYAGEGGVVNVVRLIANIQLISVVAAFIGAIAANIQLISRKSTVIRLRLENNCINAVIAARCPGAGENNCGLAVISPFKDVLHERFGEELQRSRIPVVQDRSFKRNKQTKHNLFMKTMRRGAAGFLT
ncbi:hypothetical protein [Cohnella sp. 56]|uniref:hypothetical protein n=1 Tax=Cohnella sp. 56 TaxID=3113722 RepID=UPI0030E8B1F8